MDRATAADTVDEIFDALGEEATYDSGDETTVCAAMLWRPRGERSWNGVQLPGGLGVAETGVYVLVRASEVAAPAINGAFVFADSGETWRLGGDAPIAHDIHSLVWRCRAVLEGRGL